MTCSDAIGLFKTALYCLWRGNMMINDDGCVVGDDDGVKVVKMVSCML